MYTILYIVLYYIITLGDDLRIVNMYIHYVSNKALIRQTSIYVIHSHASEIQPRCVPQLCNDTRMWKAQLFKIEVQHKNKTPEPPLPIMLTK